MNESTERKLYKAPGKAMVAGRVLCQCAHWARPIDANFRAAAFGEAALDHAPLCDGHGNATRPVYEDELTDEQRVEDAAEVRP
jgi:hypothetical protein